MKAYLKNPNLYYAVVPVVAVLWVLFVMTISLPAAGRKLSMAQISPADALLAAP